MLPCLLTDSVTYDLERAVHYALLWGLEAVELRTVGGLHDRVPFVNEQKLRGRLGESELPVAAVDPGAFVGDVSDRAAWLNELAEFGETLRFCRRLGCSRVIVSSFQGAGATSGAVEAIRRAGTQAGDLRICVINEGDYLAETGRGLAEMLDAVGLDNVRAAWDPAEAARCGEDPEEGLRHLGDRVDLVRCRNGTHTGNGWEPRPIDKGDVDWTAQLQRLASQGFDGPISLEVELEPVGQEGLRAATELIRLLRSTNRNGHP